MMKHYEKHIAYDLAFAQKVRILCGNTLNWRIFLIWKTYYKIKKNFENFQIFCDFEYYFIYVSSYIAIYTYIWLDDTLKGMTAQYTVGFIELLHQMVKNMLDNPKML